MPIRECPPIYENCSIDLSLSLSLADYYNSVCRFKYNSFGHHLKSLPEAISVIISVTVLTLGIGISLSPLNEWKVPMSFVL